MKDKGGFRSPIDGDAYLLSHIVVGDAPVGPRLVRLEERFPCRIGLPDGLVIASVKPRCDVAIWPVEVSNDSESRVLIRGKSLSVVDVKTIT